MVLIRMLTLIAISALPQALHGQGCKDTEGNWSGEQVLDASSEFTVQWSIDNDDLVLALSARNVGWMGFGFPVSSPGCPNLKALWSVLLC